MFDKPTDGYLATKLTYVLDHRHLASVIKMKVAYSNEEVEWYSFNIVKNYDAHTTANHILGND